MDTKAKLTLGVLASGIVLGGAMLEGETASAHSESLVNSQAQQESQNERWDKGWIFVGGSDTLDSVESQSEYFEAYLKELATQSKNPLNSVSVHNASQSGASIETVNSWITKGSIPQLKNGTAQTLVYMVSKEDYSKGATHLSEFKQELEKLVSNTPSYIVLQTSNNPQAEKSGYNTAIREVAKKYQGSAKVTLSDNHGRGDSRNVFQRLAYDIAPTSTHGKEALRAISTTVHKLEGKETAGNVVTTPRLATTTTTQTATTPTKKATTAKGASLVVEEKQELDPSKLTKSTAKTTSTTKFSGELVKLKTTHNDKLKTTVALFEKAVKENKAIANVEKIKVDTKTLYDSFNKDIKTLETKINAEKDSVAQKELLAIHADFKKLSLQLDNAAKAYADNKTTQKTTKQTSKVEEKTVTPTATKVNNSTAERDIKTSERNVNGYITSLKSVTRQSQIENIEKLAANDKGKVEKLSSGKETPATKEFNTTYAKYETALKTAKLTLQEKVKITPSVTTTTKTKTSGTQTSTGTKQKVDEKTLQATITNINADADAFINKLKTNHKNFGQIDVKIETKVLPKSITEGNDSKEIEKLKKEVSQVVSDINGKEEYNKGRVIVKYDVKAKTETYKVTPVKKDTATTSDKQHPKATTTTVATTQTVTPVAKTTTKATAVSTSSVSKAAEIENKSTTPQPVTNSTTTTAKTTQQTATNTSIQPVASQPTPTQTNVAQQTSQPVSQPVAQQTASQPATTATSSMPKAATTAPQQPAQQAKAVQPTQSAQATTQKNALSADSFISSQQAPAQPVQASSNGSGDSKGGKQANGKFLVTKSTTMHKTAADALSGKNSAGNLSPGEYHIYKESGGAINLTSTPGKPGAWVNASKAAEGGSTESTKKSEPAKKSSSSSSSSSSSKSSSSSSSKSSSSSYSAPKAANNARSYMAPASAKPAPRVISPTTYVYGGSKNNVTTWQDPGMANSDLINQALAKQEESSNKRAKLNTMMKSGGPNSSGLGNNAPTGSFLDIKKSFADSILGKKINGWLDEHKKKEAEKAAAAAIAKQNYINRTSPKSPTLMTVSPTTYQHAGHKNNVVEYDDPGMANSDLINQALASYGNK